MILPRLSILPSTESPRRRGSLHRIPSSRNTPDYQGPTIRRILPMRKAVLYGLAVGCMRLLFVRSERAGG